jgi:ZIP family zinc transporter
MSELLIISTLTGLTTLIGAVATLFIGTPGKKLMAFYLGLSTGMMTLVSVIDLLPASLRNGDLYGTLLGVCMGLIFLLVVQKMMNRFYPHPHLELVEQDSSLWRKTGWMMAIAIALHHIPEGIAIGAGFHAHHSIGAMIALSMSLHNIPEGIGLSAPLILGQLGRLRILIIAFLISLCIPLGAWLGELYFTSSPQAITFGMAFACGAMGYIIVKEMGPASIRLHPVSAQLGMFVSLIAMVILHFME